ncbi:MAG: CoA pyrophosphatase [Alphaproteobacteria bacterium]
MRDDLLRRIAARVAPEDPRGAPAPPALTLPRISDYDLNTHVPRPARAPEDLKAAAVLIPLMDRLDTLSVLLTRRADHLSSHPGQISFPGGRLEPHEISPVEAALREAEEEVGLPPRRVRILGLLEPYETVTGYHVTPVIGLVEGPFEPDIDPNEVAEAFEVPAAFLFDPANHERHERIFQGTVRAFYAIPYGDYYIWGATAAMLIAFYRRLYEK